EEQPAILGMIDDVHDLIFEQPRIDRVAHEAGAGDAVIDLEMAEVVPGERRDPVAPPYPRLAERVRELSCPREGLTIRVAMARLIGRDRNDLAIRVPLLCMPRDHADQQLLTHHLTKHSFPLSSSAWTCRSTNAACAPDTHERPAPECRRSHVPMIL